MDSLNQQINDGFEKAIQFTDSIQHVTDAAQDSEMVFPHLANLQSIYMLIAFSYLRDEAFTILSTLVTFRKCLKTIQHLLTEHRLAIEESKSRSCLSHWRHTLRRFANNR